LVSSINKADYHDITEILLKVVLSTITLTLYFASKSSDFLRFNFVPMNAPEYWVQVIWDQSLTYAMIGSGFYKSSLADE
jgi:hypothetical protein